MISIKLEKINQTIHELMDELKNPYARIFVICEGKCTEEDCRLLKSFDSSIKKGETITYPVNEFYLQEIKENIHTLLEENITRVYLLYEKGNEMYERCINL